MNFLIQFTPDKLVFSLLDGMNKLKLWKKTMVIKMNDGIHAIWGKFNHPKGQVKVNAKVPTLNSAVNEFNYVLIG